MSDDPLSMAQQEIEFLRQRVHELEDSWEPRKILTTPRELRDIAFNSFITSGRMERTETEKIMIRAAADIEEQDRRIRVLTAERDEARRSFCECLANGACDSRLGDWFDDDGRHLLARDAAKERGWDCFKEDGK